MITFRKLLASAALAGALLGAGAAQAAVINFEEFAPDDDNGTIPGGRYSALGVTFVGTDDSSTWGGNGAGDPGNWGIEGTNGSTFAGFNGASYGVTLLFSSNQSSFSFDVSRSNGSSNGTITLEAFLNGSSVGLTSVVLGGINQWSTLSLAGSFNEVRIGGTGSGFHPFGIDNLRFGNGPGAVPEPATWALLILGFGVVGGAMRRRTTLAYA